jgi:protein TonB
VAQLSAQAAAEARETTPAVEPPLAAAEKGVEPEAPVEDIGIALPAAPARTRGGSKLIWFAVGAIFPLLLSGILFVYPGVFHRTTLPLAGKDTSPLALRVERTGSELLLTWNNDSSAIRNASRAVLSISDGEQHENVDMDLAQLRNGRIEYLPVTGDVVFRMEVSGKDNAKTASESVRVLRTRPSPMPPDSQTQDAQNPAAKPPTPNGPPNAAPNASAGSNTAAPNTAAPNTAPPTTPSTETETAAVAQPSPAAPLKPFNTASLSARLRPVASDDFALPDAPTVGGGQSMAASDAALKLAGVSPTALPPAPRKGDASPAPKQSAAPTGGDVQQAQLIVRKNPEYPALARSAGAKGNVELLATIGTNGRVKSVKVMHGHPLLQKAAVDAVMQWQYRPTMLNGHPVETETTITVNFVSDR